MALKDKTSLADQNLCQGGRSWGCRHEEHPKSQKRPNIYCYRCGERMGCFLCVQIPEELLCLRCHDWATEKAMGKHGPIVVDKKMAIQKVIEGLSPRALLREQARKLGV